MPRPLIGVTAYQEQARWGVWDLPSVLIPQAYVGQVAAAGGVPLVIPPLALASAADTDALVSKLDGLILAGGADLSPSLYGEQPHPETTGLRPDRDAAELALAERAVTDNVPTLGICRGMQLLSVIHGGTLIQHLPEQVGHNGHRPGPAVFGEHSVRLAAGSLPQSILGEQTTVRSYHHQGVASCGAMTASGWAEDGSIEAVELPNHAFALGVLWHPEMGDDPQVFQALIRAASTAPTG